MFRSINIIISLIHKLSNLDILLLNILIFVPVFCPIVVQEVHSYAEEDKLFKSGYHNA